MNLSFDLAVNIPKLNFTGKYSLKMKMLLLNLQGKGDLKGSLSKYYGAIFRLDVSPFTVAVITRFILRAVIPMRCSYEPVLNNNMLSDLNNVRNTGVVYL